MLRYPTLTLTSILLVSAACSPATPEDTNGSTSPKDDDDSSRSEDSSSGSAEPEDDEDHEDSDSADSTSSTSGNGTTSSSTSTSTSGGSTTSLDGTTSSTTGTLSDGVTETGSTTDSAESGDASDAVFVEDFEGMAAGAAPDSAVWTLGMNGTPMGASVDITITTEEAHGGSQSARVSTSTNAYLSTTMGFPPPQGVVYFRFWMKYTADDWTGHVTFASSGTSADPGSSEEVRLGGMNLYYNANLGVTDALSPDPFEYPTCSQCVAPVANEWHCIQGMFDAANDVVQAYVDGELAIDASSAEDWHTNSAGDLPSTLTRLSLGWHAHNGSPANTVYFDDLAIGHAGHIDCL